MLELIEGEENVQEKYNLDMLFDYNQEKLNCKLAECNSVYEICYEVD